jgi:hypothetical protein
LGAIAVCEPADMDTSHDAIMIAFPKIFVNAANRKEYLGDTVEKYSSEKLGMRKAKFPLIEKAE